MHHFWGLKSLKCTNLDEILHGHPQLSKKCFGAVLTLDHLPPVWGSMVKMGVKGNGGVQVNGEIWERAGKWLGVTSNGYLVKCCRLQG